MNLAHQISQKSEDFFSAMASQDQLQLHVGETISDVQHLQRKVKRVKEVVCKGFLEVLRLTALRSRYSSVHEKVILCQRKLFSVCVCLCFTCSAVSAAYHHIIAHCCFSALTDQCMLCFDISFLLPVIACLHALTEQRMLFLCQQLEWNLLISAFIAQCCFSVLIDQCMPFLCQQLEWNLLISAFSIYNTSE